MIACGARRPGRRVKPLGHPMTPRRPQASGFSLGEEHHAATLIVEPDALDRAVDAERLVRNEATALDIVFAAIPGKLRGAKPMGARAFT